MLNNNPNRLKALSFFCEEKERDPNIRDRVSHFVAGFDICAQSRNFLMHGITRKALSSEKLILQKYSRNDFSKRNYLELTAEDIRSVADDIARFDDFGNALGSCLLSRFLDSELTFADGSRGRPTLPKKPPLPEKLRAADAFPQGDPPLSA
jgi:hypothetical protein